MKARIYVSCYDALFVAMEDIFLQFKNDYFLDDFDFIVFAISDKFHPEDINPTIKRIFQTDKYFAFNSEESFSHSYINNSITALFLKFENKGKISIKSLDSLNKDKLNIVFIPYNNEKCICDDLDKIKIPLIGGVCSGERAYIYYEGKIEKEKPIVLEFDNVDYKFGISLGYKPIGPTYKINVSLKNKLYVIDYEDASLLTKKLLKNTNGKIENLWYSPLLVISDNTGIVDVVRTFKSIKENFYTEFFGNIKRDSKVKLSFATAEILLEEDKKVALNLKRKISPDLVFNFVSNAREFVLGELKSKESEIYAEILNAPVFGFTTFGEIGPDYKHQKPKLYNQSSLIVAIKEK